MHDETLSFWEPGAPNFEDRYTSLKSAFFMGFKTSISIEPFLDYNPIPLVEKIRPFVTESIWIGKMNYIARNGVTLLDRPYYDSIRQNYHLKHILEIYDNYKTDPLIRWKDSIKKMLMLEKIRIKN